MGRTLSLLMNARSRARSRNGSAPIARPVSASPRLAASTGSDSRRSSQAPIRTSVWCRIVSSRPNTSRAKPASTVSATRVSTWPLGSTRSNTWNM
jgi:hypothetical protein